MSFDRILVFFGGLCGAAGVALSAAAAHRGGGDIATAAAMLLAHAPAFLAVGLLAGPRLLRIGAGILFAGLLMFSPDLLCRQYLGGRLFPFAAPAGGMAMIAGWCVIAAAGLAWRRGESR
jgi:uncharacterized membrane protein YgdD (TMEM256/DUF423 family)